MEQKHCSESGGICGFARTDEQTDRRDYVLIQTDMVVDKAQREAYTGSVASEAAEAHCSRRSFAISMEREVATGTRRHVIDMSVRNRSRKTYRRLH